MARGGCGLPRISAVPTMLYPTTPCRWDTLETAIRPFQGWPVNRVGSLRPCSTPLDTPRRTRLRTGRKRKDRNLSGTLEGLEEGWVRVIAVWREVSKGVEDGHSPPALPVGLPLKRL
jgi:hypothetical protein